MTLQRRRLLTAAAALAAVAPWTLAPQAASANASGGHAWLPESRRIGAATLRMIGLHIYDAQLYALPAFEANRFATHPLVLELQYRRKFTGVSIAERSLKEMRRGGAIDDANAARWLRFMSEAFPDVQPGDRLTGQWTPGSGVTRFAANAGTPTELQDADFGPRFFGIWLATHTSQPEMREQLLGQRA